jgi:hypothetical protein
MNGVEMLCLCVLKSIHDTLKLYLPLGPLRKEENSRELFSFRPPPPVISILLKVISVP